MSKRTEKIIYIYHDMDHGDLEVFDSLKKAKSYGEECWGNIGDEDFDKWKECSNTSWSRGEYQRIYMGKIK